MNKSIVTEAAATKSVRTLARRLLTEKKGATMVEYGLMLALVLVIAAAAFKKLGGGVNDQAGKAADCVAQGNCP